MMQPTAPIVEQLLDLMARRQEALSANVANMDTPGYRAADYRFEQELASMTLKTTHPAHLKPADDSGTRRFEVQSTVKPNGNDVNLERELTEITKNGMQYVTLVQFLSQKIRTLRSSIKEGNGV
jgi:flagellar basal-body rod protein FlgB